MTWAVCSDMAQSGLQSFSQAEVNITSVPKQKLATAFAQPRCSFFSLKSQGFVCCGAYPPTEEQGDVAYPPHPFGVVAFIFASRPTCKAAQR